MEQVAQKKFANAKAISSKDFNNEDSKDSEYEKQARLTRFQGANSISSADYFGGGGAGGGSGNGGGNTNGAGGSGSASGRVASGTNDYDLSATDLVNRLSLQVRGV